MPLTAVKKIKMSKIKLPKKNAENKNAYFISALRSVINSCEGEFISLGQLLTFLKDDGLIFLIAMVALPTSIPIPTPPGFTALFGIPLCILTIQMIYSYDKPWLPDWLSHRKIKIETFKKVIDKAEPAFIKITSLLKPRYGRFLTRRMEQLAGVLTFACAIAITLPIIFGNWVPSIGILITAIGFLYKDGLAVMVGMCVCAIGIIICILVVWIIFYYGMAVLKSFLPTFMHVLVDH